MEKDLGKIKKNDFTDIIVRLDDFGGRPGVTIREFVTGDRYTGFTKSGVKIQASDLPRFKEMINSITEKDLEVSETAKEKTESHRESQKKPAHNSAQKTLPEKDIGEEKGEETEEESEEETEFEDY
jgi:TATA-binding protein-associated factor Taf7